MNFFILLVKIPMLPVSLDCPFLIAIRFSQTFIYSISPYVFLFVETQVHIVCVSRVRLLLSEPSILIKSSSHDTAVTIIANNLPFVCRLSPTT